jgi:CRISPR-associated protein Cas5t
MFILHVQAAFAAFRTLTAGSYRESAPFITPSAAYGLLLNTAGIDSRFEDGVSAMTRMRGGLPPVAIAVGMLSEPEVCSLYQQLHSYPPGEGNKVVAPETGRKVGERELGLARTKYGKWRVTPVRRELLCGIDGYIAIQENDQFETEIRDGLAAGVSRPRPDGRPRYGVPFLGDNNLLIDRLTVLKPGEQRAARWYCLLHKLPTGAVSEVRSGTCRMTYCIDRADMSRTKSDLYAPQVEPTMNIPDSAWTRIVPTP